MSAKFRVAVLGGGCAGTAAAFALTSTPRLRRLVDVTVYEQSFRLGGKGATGRDPQHGHRIHEHGLHVWMGFYEHTFSAMRACLEEWAPPPASPLRSFHDAFVPRYDFTMTDAHGPWRLALPPRPGLPGDGGRLPRVGASDVLAYVRSLASSLRGGKIGRRRGAALVRLAIAALRGLACERSQAEDPWSRMNDEDLRAWLRRHGAGEAGANAGPIAAFYDMAFAYPDGVSGPGRGSVAAGAAMRSLLRMLFCYRGAPMWLLRFGMGDTAFAPLYQVLSRRGVRFAFFHRTRRVVPTSRGGDVGTIDLERYGPAMYAPLVDVHGLPCWPDRPRVELEPATPVTLRRGRDFDAVVLAVPVGALPPILAPLAERSPRIRRMLANAHTVATKAAQLWLDGDGKDESPIATSMRGPFATAAALPEVLRAEPWSEKSRPSRLVYLVDTLPDEAPDDVAADVERWRCETAPALLGGTPTHAAPAYTRINREAWERYVLTLPGTPASRLAPDDTGFSNLRFAGDWTHTSIDGGSVEAAFESADLAARSLVT